MNKRERRPSMAQQPILEALAYLGGEAEHQDVVHRIEYLRERSPGVAQWVAVADAGWVIVDRGTEDNRGGNLSEYRYTLTPAGWAILDRTPGGAA